MATRRVVVGLRFFSSKRMNDCCFGRRMMCTRKDRFSYLADRAYWEQRYLVEGQQQFEWLLPFQSLSDHIQSYLPKSPFTFLDVGCGNSMFTQSLIQSSQVTISAWCVDFSYEAINLLMKSWTKSISDQKNSQCSLLYGVVADTEELPFKDCAFDVVFDKGTTDSLLKAEDGKVRSERMIKECLRVVKPGGIVLQITDEDLDSRLPMLEDIVGCRKKISFSVIQEQNGQEYLLYGITKLE